MVSVLPSLPTFRNYGERPLYQILGSEKHLSGPTPIISQLANKRFLTKIILSNDCLTVTFNHFQTKMTNLWSTPLDL